MITPCALAQQQDAQTLRNGAAGVEVEWGANAATRQGSGFVVSVEGQTVTVLTARHLFAEGRERFAGPIRITFYLDRLTAYPAKLLAESAALDLAVLKVEDVSAGIGGQMPTYTVRPDSQPIFLTERLHIFGGKGQGWQVAAGEISDVGDGDDPNRFNFDGRGTREGFSGAPVMDENFQLVGVHLGATDREEAFARAVKMSVAFAVLTQRLGVRVMNRLVKAGMPVTPGPAAGQSRTNAKDGLTYVWIPAGRFQMGCSDRDGECYDDEKPAHPVTLTKGFWLAQTTATVGAWRKYRTEAKIDALPTEDTFGRKNLNEASGNDRMPATAMTWNEAKNFCEWAGGRLPTEAEWEYAARAGSGASRYGRIDDIAWYGDNSGRRRIESQKLWDADPKAESYGKKLYENGNGPHEVGAKQPNAWKLFDMLGNAWQWTADLYDEKYYTPADVVDPGGPSTGTQYALRGGSWNSSPRFVRVSDLYRNVPGSRVNYIGVRCVGEKFP